MLPAQHPVPPQVELAQHPWPAPPHAVRVPLLHTVPAGPSAPAGMQLPVAASRHAPPLQVVPPQAGWKAPPQGAQVPAVHTALVPAHWVPPQQGWPTPPQPSHWPEARH